jgi:hypothetical protein
MPIDRTSPCLLTEFALLSMLVPDKEIDHRNDGAQDKCDHNRDRRGKDFGRIIETRWNSDRVDSIYFSAPLFLHHAMALLYPRPHLVSDDAKLYARVKRCVILRHYPDY